MNAFDWEAWAVTARIENHKLGRQGWDAYSEWFYGSTHGLTRDQSEDLRRDYRVSQISAARAQPEPVPEWWGISGPMAGEVA